MSLKSNTPLTALAMLEMSPRVSGVVTQTIAFGSERKEIKTRVRVNLVESRNMAVTTATTASLFSTWINQFMCV